MLQQFWTTLHIVKFDDDSKNHHPLYKDNMNRVLHSSCSRYLLNDQRFLSLAGGTLADELLLDDFAGWGELSNCLRITFFSVHQSVVNREISLSMFPIEIFFIWLGHLAGLVHEATRRRWGHKETRHRSKQTKSWVIRDARSSNLSSLGDSLPQSKVDNDPSKGHNGQELPLNATKVF